MPKKAFWSHVAVIMIIYIVTFNLHPAAVVGQTVSGVFQKNRTSCTGATAGDHTKAGI